MSSRRLFVAILFLTSALWMSEARAATVTVNLPAGQTAFVPQFVNVEVGDTVMWVNPTGGGNHNVAADDSSFINGPPALGPWTFSHQFNSAGIIGYHCQIHGTAGVGMYGIVYVRATHAANEHVLQLNAWDLQPQGSGLGTGSLAGFYRTITGGAPATLIAGVNLPSGTTITGIEMTACDNDLSNDITLALTRCVEPQMTCTTVTTAATTMGPGCGFFSSPAITEVVQNLNYAYLLNVSDTSASANLGFRTVRVYYRSAISSPPATPTFTDVPTTHPFYQYIEALVASGATAGCSASPPQYCPDAAVTRGQMAVFLARSLGLFWPN